MRNITFGFTSLVQAEEKVDIGQALMEFNVDYIKDNAEDTITPIVITNNADLNKQLVMTKETTSIPSQTVLINCVS